MRAKPAEERIQKTIKMSPELEQQIIAISEAEVRDFSGQVEYWLKRCVETWLLDGRSAVKSATLENGKREARDSMLKPHDGPEGK